jgi:DinB superfamily
MATIEDVARQPLERRLARMERTADDFAAAMHGVTEAVLSRRPDEKNWAAKEIVCHLRDIEELWTVRARCSLRTIRCSSGTTLIAGLRSSTFATMRPRRSQRSAFGGRRPMTFSGSFHKTNCNEPVTMLFWAVSRSTGSSVSSPGTTTTTWTSSSAPLKASPDVPGAGITGRRGLS